MGKLHDTYQLTITTLSPLHIGTGNTLLRDFDYVARGGKTWVIDTDELAARLYDESPGEFDRMLKGVPAGQLLNAGDYKEDSPLFRYIMPGEPRSRQAGAVLQEQLKDPWDRPYIPGSSLKGALRTALVYAGWRERKLVFNPQDLGSDARSAAQSLEHMVLSGREKTPYYDLLRALQVGDSAPDEERRLRLINVQVITGNKTGSPIELEAIPRDVTFRATLSLDGFLRQKDTAESLGWQDDQLRWLKNIPRVVNYFTKPRLHNEIKRWQNQEAQINSFYATLARIATEQLQEQSEFLLQLGWGGGWDSKTLGAVLTENKEAFAEVVRCYRQMDRQGSFRRGDRYPKSRRIVVDANGRPVAPLGWIRVRMEAV